MQSIHKDSRISNQHPKKLISFTTIKPKRNVEKKRLLQNANNKKSYHKDARLLFNNFNYFKKQFFLRTKCKCSEFKGGVLYAGLVGREWTQTPLYPIHEYFQQNKVFR